ncbi:MAG: thioredoxin domain-containing protein [Alphaproteobacteria bacterium]|nr:thioredoxin domain-containing protein [Alphaproteobacteria bacterium]
MSGSTDPSSPARPHRPWALGLLIVLMFLGSAVGVYMARHHEVELYGGEAYQGEHLIGCEEAAGVSCDIVNTSEWSEILGVPTFAWAVPTYLLIALLAGLAMRGQHRFKPIIALMGVGAVGLSVWLYYVSVYQLGYVCLWCMRLYGINLSILVLSLVSGITRDDLPQGRQLGVAAGGFAVLAGLMLAVQQGFRAHLLDGAPAMAALAEATDKAEEISGADPTGPAPALAFDVTTEDGNKARIEIHPDDAWKGNPEAKVAIVEFGDFECGYCKRASFQLRRLYEAYKDDIVFVYKNFPLDPACNPGVNNKRHAYACTAHFAAVCAQQQGKFWAYHDLLYKNNHQLHDDNLLAYAEAVGLDMNAFKACMGTPAPRDKVRSNGEDGQAVDTHGTPRVWIDGKLYRSGTSAEQMARAIEAALGHDASQAAQAAAKMREELPRVVPIPGDVPPMQHIVQGSLDFWIDTFESSLVEGTAASGKHEIPATNMSWFGAHDACTKAGKRMCTEQEWVAACQGAEPIDDDGDGEFADDMIEGNAYPYADFHTPGLCWDGKDGPPASPDQPWRPVYTGEMPGCVTASGVYDLTGNVEEWVGATEASAVLLGGAFDTADDHARCYRRNDTFGAGYNNQRTGFRCCRNP